MIINCTSSGIDIKLLLQSELTVGDIVCFSMPLLNEDGERGVWSTVDGDVIVMETGAGLARAVKPGRAVVKYSLGDYVTTATSLDVHPLQYVSVAPNHPVCFYLSCYKR